MALKDDLFDHWDMGAASGNETGLHAFKVLVETSGTIDSVAGKVGNARDFELGDSEKFTLADEAGISGGDRDFTLAFWLNPESLDTRPILGKWDWAVDSKNEYLVWTSSDSLRFSVSSNGSSLSASAIWGSISTGTWIFVVVRHNAAANEISINVNASGSPVTTSFSGGTFDSDHDFEVGGSNADHYDGAIDELSFWGRVLMSEEETQLYNGGAGVAFADWTPPEIQGGIPFALQRFRQRRGLRPRPFAPGVAR